MNAISSLNKEEFVNKLDANYTLQEILDFLKEYKYGEEDVWIDNLLHKLTGIFGENDEIKNEIGIVRRCAIAVPKAFNISVHSMIFITRFLSDIGISSIKELNSFEGDLKEVYS